MDNSQKLLKCFIFEFLLPIITIWIGNLAKKNQFKFNNQNLNFVKYLKIVL